MECALHCMDQRWGKVSSRVTGVQAMMTQNQPGLRGQAVHTRQMRSLYFLFFLIRCFSVPVELATRNGRSEKFWCEFSD